MFLIAAILGLAVLLCLLLPFVFLPERLYQINQHLVCDYAHSGYLHIVTLLLYHSIVAKDTIDTTTQRTGILVLCYDFLYCAVLRPALLVTIKSIPVSSTF